VVGGSRLDAAVSSLKSTISAQSLHLKTKKELPPSPLVQDAEASPFK